ncbi:MAG TPA: hypothetical protein VFO85_10160 [Vicinamibacteria bacterium]|nr:hypothetical protein [Vicinamibacteria bacterium]
MVRCRLDGSPHFAALRYVPLAEFGLWQYLMENKHGRQVAVEQVSVWVPEDASQWNSGYEADELEPVLRVRFERKGAEGLNVPVERYFPAETYPEAQEALLQHYQGVPTSPVEATPGYFIPVRTARPVPLSTPA